jgi:hypothetical protein
MNKRISPLSTPDALRSVSHRIESYEWQDILRELDTAGSAVLPKLLDAEQCESLAALYEHDDLFRSRVVMARHGFGRGEYQYFDYPLPPMVDHLRTSLYSRLVSVANAWNRTLRIETEFPTSHAEYLEHCAASGQTKPTPLLLRYTAGDFNCLHQDLYGERVFPIQVAVLLAEPDIDFSGGEFVLTEQRPRMQSRVEVIPLRRGDAVTFAVNNRPVIGARGAYRVNLRHGVSRLRSGRRHTLGIIFHDAA